MARLPIPGQDKGTWGSVLNEYLEVVHATNGSLKDGVVQESTILGTISQSKVANLTTDLGAKANASSLAAVATSGNYSDLSSKPTLTSLGGDTRYYQKTETVPVIVLNDGDPVPGGTPNGTVVFYRSV